jgi:hypothetical protein
MTDSSITEQEARVRAQQLFRAYLGMLALIHAGHAGWALVAESLDDAAREARQRIRVDTELGR